MHACPSWNRQQHIIAILAAVKYLHIIKIKIHDMYLAVGYTSLLSSFIIFVCA